MDKQAREAREHMKALPLKEKWANFWFYYKKHVIIGVFTAIVVIASTVQCANRTKYDLRVSYYSTNGTLSTSISELENLMKSTAVDTTGNDIVDIGISLSVADPYNQMDEQTQAVMMKLETERAVGESMGYIFDENYKTIALSEDNGWVDTILDISLIPEIRDMLGVAEGEKLYWCTKKVYQVEKDDEERLKEHENAVRIEKMFVKMGAEIIEND